MAQLAGEDPFPQSPSSSTQGWPYRTVRIEGRSMLLSARVALRLVHPSHGLGVRGHGGTRPGIAP